MVIQYGFLFIVSPSFWRLVGHNLKILKADGLNNEDDDNEKQEERSPSKEVKKQATVRMESTEGGEDAA